MIKLSSRAVIKVDNHIFNSLTFEACLLHATSFDIITYINIQYTSNV